jgi:hypothetical protein
MFEIASLGAFPGLHFTQMGHFMKRKAKEICSDDISDFS